VRTRSLVPPRLECQRLTHLSLLRAAAAPPSRYPLINDQLMEAVIKCVADKVQKGEIRSELDIVDIAQVRLPTSSCCSSRGSS